MSDNPSKPPEMAKDCEHTDIEYLGHDQGTNFLRCRACARVYVVQGALVLEVPGVNPKQAA